MEYGSSSSLEGSHPCYHFKFLDIQQATNYFDESLVIGRGGFGKVYRATISNGSTLVDAAIKRLDSFSNQGATEFWAEVEIVSKLRHCNLVSLIGYCSHEEELILVYEYMPNGTLHDHLHKLGTSLSWLLRLKICIGAARGLDYLHTGTGIDVGVIHRDIKTSNILLHESWAAKISDFGCALDTTLEEQQQNLAEWAQESIIEGDLNHIIDSDIKDQMSVMCLKEFARIANQCLQRKSNQRPTMAEVVVALESVLTLQENINNSPQPVDETMFGGTVDMLSFPSNDDNIGSQPCRLFEFAEIQQATNDFDESLVIGHGGFGTVYKGKVLMGSSLVVTAIKRLDSMSSQGAVEFWAEIQILSKLRHCNLVSLVGYCNHGKEMILIYEYMSNGTLEDHLHKHGTPLSWLQRLKICIGAGRGLHYLHTGTGIEVGVIHRDVKSSNILLHASWTAKISDFGLSKTGPTDQPSTYVNTVVRGTFGYLDPDYSYTGKLTRKSDVYAFGVVLLEVLCGRPALDRSLDDNKQNLARWAQESIKEGNLRHIIDSKVRDQISQKCLKEFVLIVERCLHDNQKKRPTMAEVVGSLESVLTLQQRINNSMQTANRRIFGRMLDMIGFPSKGGISVFIYSAADYKIPSLKKFLFSDLVWATKNFNQDGHLRRGGFGTVTLGWVDKNTFAPSIPGVGIAVAVKRLDLPGRQGLEAWQVSINYCTSTYIYYNQDKKLFPWKIVGFQILFSCGSYQ
ncbi:hypothetical protein OSB04_014932 [Centaurea solstitialis]|uniref:Protein kinase domain-containing protein n=1 Tax=Centaurea solstitialis TaxID=347529 RepID=A0AA38TGA4_9ASTR|nr:hypothetical protein OSB04_014932 [Centaurea solstitialis]